jgi:thiol:disulfide interchange protein DsbC
MLKLLMILILSNVMLFATEDRLDDLDAKVIAFVEKTVASNENYVFDKVTILKKEDLPETKTWKAYAIRVDVILLKQENKKISMNDIVFTDGIILSKDFIDLKSGQSIKNTLFTSH